MIQNGLTLAWRSLLKIKHSPEQLLDVTMTPIVFVVLFVFLFGGAVAGRWQDYLQSVLPGIMVQTVLFASMGTGTAINTDITKGIFDRFRSLPIARSAPLVGHVLGDVARYLVSLAVVLAFGTSLGFRIRTGPLPALAACLLLLGFALAVSWIPTILGLLVRTPQTVQGIGFFVLFPLTFGSNIFVRPSTLPGWLQAWVSVNPVTHLVDATRGLLRGGAVAEPGLLTVVWMVGLVVVFAPAAIAIYRRRA
jgi:oleandomycin transport system permease protein